MSMYICVGGCVCVRECVSVCVDYAYVRMWMISEYTHTRTVQEAHSALGAAKGPTGREGTHVDVCTITHIYTHV
jgi:hypothetical protein